MNLPRILVMGAINQDETARVDQLPVSGETVVTDQIAFHCGGKGANQAAAAARAGFPVHVQMLGAVGEDLAGDDQLAALTKAGVDVSLVRRVIGKPTGRAYITVARSGANSIVVGLGANAYVSPVSVRGAEHPTLVVAQTEVGAAPVNALAAFAIRSKARFVLNNGPAVALDPATLAAADPLVVNEPEALQMLGSVAAPSVDLHIAMENAKCLLNEVEARSVVLTMGDAGSVVADDMGARHIAPVPVGGVVDTTGAGDTFVGVLAAALAAGRTLDAAAAVASAAASRAVTWHGAREPLDLPTPPLAHLSTNR